MTALEAALVQFVTDKFGERPVTLASVPGGFIATATRIVLQSGRELFAKQAGGMPADAFHAEAAGLRALAACKELRIPQILSVTDNLLILEWVQPDRPHADYMERFGRGFAALHRIHGESFGFDHDNYLGRTPQPNTPRSNNWPEFYYVNRLEYQLKLAESNGYADDALRAAVRNLERKIDDLLADSAEPPTLLHGDLWSGNALADAANNPVIIDPAVYYGHREADLAMTRIFGGFSPAFYAAYNEASPLPAGERDRRPLYEAWHLLNHLNLFGTSYYQQSLSALRHYN